MKPVSLIIISFLFFTLFACINEEKACSGLKSNENKNELFDDKSLELFCQKYAPILGPELQKELTDSQYLIKEVREASRTYGVPWREVASVLFPELLRYSQFRDFFETKSLEVLYTASGKEAADFSIGVFQMKPSFIEELEKSIKSDSSAEMQDFLFLTKYSSGFPEEIRSQRLQRIHDPSWQVQYACSFYAVTISKFPWLKSTSEIERVKFVSSAYNLGLKATPEEIFRWASEKAFPYGSGIKAPQESYSHLAMDIFRLMSN